MQFAPILCLIQVAEIKIVCILFQLRAELRLVQKPGISDTSHVSGELFKKRPPQQSNLPAAQ